MTIPAMLDKLIFGPQLLLFDAISKLAYRSVTRNPGLLIIFLSLAMNLLVLPLYRRADAMQEEERLQSLAMQPGVDHIKKTFKGNERFMMLQTFYRQHHYKPWYALKGSLSLLLEVPFFIAAYRFLSSLQLLDGVAFGPIRDLALPDGLLPVAGHAVNLLPILMTGINIVSGAIYTRGMPLRSKVQLYGMALVFLVLLYGSPSGLVFYWTLNNVFSLVKNVFYKLRDPRKVIAALCSALGLALLVLLLAGFGGRSKARTLFLLVGGLAMQLPLILRRIRKRRGPRPEIPETRSDRALFTVCCLFLALFLGLYIPLNVIKSSPQEFIDITNYHSSLDYVLSSGLLAAGTFLIWCLVFYRLSGGKARRWFSFGAAAFSVVAVVDYTFFGDEYGTMNPELQYDFALKIQKSRYLVNLLVVAAIAAAIWLILKRRPALMRIVGIAGCAAVLGISVMDAAAIQASNRELLATLDAESIEEQAVIPLDRTGKNVMVIMLDRAIGRYLPFIFQEKPELKDSFAGFTYYPNALSYGAHTNVGAPPLFGGYEYTPTEMNRRDDVLLVDKHDEALKLMPTLFSGLGYDITICDPPYAGYGEVSDLSIFDDLPRTNAYITMTANAIDDPVMRESSEGIRHRNFFCYGLFRASPLVLHKILYDRGQYNEMAPKWTQVATGISKAHGISYGFMKRYSVLNKLPGYSRIRDEGRGTFLMINNETTHTPTLLQEPAYEPAMDVDNTAYDREHEVRRALDGSEMRITTLRQMQHYHNNMAAMLQLGRWMDYLRENGVYDNTRIIIVADHGYRLDGLFDLCLTPSMDMLYFNPLMMVKDFDSREFTIDESFMTNADTPLLAVRGLIDDPVNPFTGKALTDDAKREPEQLVVNTGNFRPLTSKGARFTKLMWFSNADAPLEFSAWKYLGNEPERQGKTMARGQ